MLFRRSLLLFTTLFAGCTSIRPTNDVLPPSSFLDSAWHLVTIGGERVDAGATIAFGSDGRFNGLAGCNRYFGTYEVREGRLELSQVGATRMACPPPVMARERAFLDALGRADRAVVSSGALDLLGSGGEPQLGFEAASETDRATLTGSVTYLPRIALPPTATVRVALLEVSRADAPAETLAEEVVSTEGRSVPIPFSLRYTPSEIEPHGRYVVRAKILDAAGDLLWTTDTAYPVLTNGAPSEGVEVRVVQVAGGGRAARALVGPTWHLVEIHEDGGVTVSLDGETYTLVFGANGRYSGQADCNSYGGAFEADSDDTLDLTHGLTTLVACPTPSASGAFLGVLNEVEGYDVTGNRLTLHTGGGGRLVFERDGQGGMPPQETLQDYAYTCQSLAGPFTFRIRTGPGEIALWLPERFEGREGGTYRVLGQVVSASGAKYQDGPVMVWTKGLAEALLEVDGEEFFDCRR